VKIIRAGTEQAAAQVSGYFQCFPKSENNRGTAVRFSTIERAASFLCENPEWGIQMDPGGELVYRNIVIERD
jgi:hypothetical protein